MKNFYELDILTQLTLLDMFDQSINNKTIARFLLDNLNLFENVREIYLFKLQKNEIQCQSTAQRSDSWRSPTSHF